MPHKKVMLFGSFDIIHEGHRYVFRKAKEYGDWLIVVVARDSRYNELRSQKAQHKEQERLRLLKEEKLVDEAILGDERDVYKVIWEKKPDVIVLGYDQTYYTNGLRERLKEYGLRATDVVRLDAYKPDEFKSSILKRRK